MPIAPIKHGPAPRGVAAIVGSQKISRAQVSDLAMQIYGQTIVDQLITHALIDQEAKRQHIVVTDAEVNAKLQDVTHQIAQRAPGKTLNDLLDARHLTLADFKDNVKVQTEVEKMIGGHMATPTLVHAQHILVLTTNLSGGANKVPRTDADAKALIAKAQSDLKAGQPWETVARKYSEDPSDKDQGGELGIIGPPGLIRPSDPQQPVSALDPAFLQAALTLKRGETTNAPVKSVYGYHLIRVTSTGTDAQNTPAEKALYAAAAKVIVDQAVGQQAPAFIDSLKRKTPVQNYLTP